MKDSPPLHIVELCVENVKGIQEATIRPTGPVIEVCGENEAGKTTLVDSILWAVRGARSIQTKPIRKGEHEATIKVDLGLLNIQRTFKDRGPDRKPSTKVAVRNAEGGVYQSPQRMLDDMISALSMDPTAVLDAKPAAQARMLLEIAGVDFAEHDRLQRRDYQLRRDHKRDQERARNQAEGLRQDNPPKAKVTVKALTSELAKAHAHNNAITEALRKIGEHRDRIADIDRLANKKLAEAEKLRKEVATLMDEQRTIERSLAASETLPDPTDTEPIQAQIEQAGEINALVDQEERYQKHQANAKRHGEAAWKLSSEIEGRKMDLEEKLANSPLPVKGLTVEDNVVHYNGIPLDQCADAVQLRVACAITMADDPQVRVIRIRHGSLLDDNSMAALAKMAEEEGWQVWIERVGERTVGDCAVILREGKVAQ